MDILIHKDYFQKSRVFLYSTLGHRRGCGIVPINTFIQWKGYYEISDMKLCLAYDLRDDIEFRKFEDEKLTGHKLFHDFKQVDGNRGVYVFDFSCQEKNWKWFMLSRYSYFDDSYKKMILDYYGAKSANFPYVESFLYPEKYFKIYSEQLGVDYTTLHLVGELCTKVNLEKETLEISPIEIGVNL